MTPMKTLLGMAAALAICSQTASAAAETKTTKHEKGYGYFFDADRVSSNGSSPYDTWFKGRWPKPRVLLIRPRTEFVSELQRSAEAL